VVVPFIVQPAIKSEQLYDSRTNNIKDTRQRYVTPYLRHVA